MNSSRSDCRTRAEHWCAQTAGMRIHAAARLRPAEVSAAEETNCSVAPGN